MKLPKIYEDAYKKDNEKTTSQEALINQEKIRKFKTDSFTMKVNQYLPEAEISQSFMENALLQPNEISRAIYGMSTTSMKIFCHLIKQFKIEQRTSNNRSFAFDLKNIISDLKLRDSGKYREIFKTTINNLISINIAVENEKRYDTMNIFDKAGFDKETDIANISFSEPFATILDRKTGGRFTVLDYEEMINLSSFYAIRFYQIAMSYKGFKGKFRKRNSDWIKENIKNLKNSWFFPLSVEQIKFLFQISEKHQRSSNLLKCVIEQPFQELAEKVKDYDFKYQVIRKNNKPKSPIEGFIFWVTDKTETSKTKAKKEKQEQSLTLENFVPYDVQQYYDEKAEEKKKFQEDDQKPIFDMLEKYPEEFNKRLEEVSKQPHMLRMPILFKYEVYKSMIADGFSLDDEQK